MSSRRLSDWLSGYLEYTKESEPPLSYHVWIGLSMIAAALQRRAYIRWGYEVIYPNMYIVLVGPSGRCRKGSAMSIGKDIIKGVKINLTSESITREALIRNIKRAADSYSDPEQGIVFHCSLTAMSSELSVFLGQNDVKFLADLTDWYDSLDRWTYETKGSGTDEIQGMCFNLLGATAPEWLQSILPEEAIGGGFTSRIIFVVEENKRKTIPEPIITPELLEIRQALKEDIERICLMSGSFEFSDDAKALYSAWYQEQDDKMRDGIYAVDDPRFAGYCDRRATHIRKLCMVFSASRGDDLFITPDDFTRSLDVLTSAEKKMAKVFGGLGSAPYAKITEKLLNFIRSKGRVSRSQVLTTFYRDIDMSILETIEKTLSSMKIVKVIVSTESNEVFYEWIVKS